MRINASSIQAPYQSACYATGKFSLSASYLEMTGSLSSVSGDEASVSDAAKRLLERAKSLDIFKIIFPNDDVSKKQKTLDDVEGDFNQDFMNFSSMFGKLAGMLGLGANESLTMGLNGVGGVDVEGEEDAVRKVQGAFNGSGTMVSRFAVMAARAALVDARGTVDGFGAQYENDPVAAIKNNIDSLKERLLGFRTVSGENEMIYGFMRQFNASIQFSAGSIRYSSGSEEANAAVTEAATAIEAAPETDEADAA
ncbi:MAG: hypothetical protein LBJ46_09350 [Planctomycetota bacterium]|nr:hypothetical protein [Planctomycetota bacterium]